jgi:hypothetical protein
MKVKTVSYAKLVSFERFNNHRAEVVIEVEEGDIAQEVLETAKALVDQALEVEKEANQGAYDWPDVQGIVKEENFPEGEPLRKQENEDWELAPDGEAPQEPLDPADKVTFFCSTCGKTFPDFEGLLKHRRGSLVSSLVNGEGAL